MLFQPFLPSRLIVDEWRLQRDGVNCHVPFRVTGSNKCYFVGWIYYWVIISPFIKSLWNSSSLWFIKIWKNLLIKLLIPICTGLFPRRTHVRLVISRPSVLFTGSLRLLRNNIRFSFWFISPAISIRKHFKKTSQTQKSTRRFHHLGCHFCRVVLV